MTLVESKLRLAALLLAQSSGVKSVDVNGRKIEYQSLADMQAHIDRLLRDIARAEGKPSVRIATWSGCK